MSCVEVDVMEELLIVLIPSILSIVGGLFIVLSYGLFPCIRSSSQREYNINIQLNIGWVVEEGTSHDVFYFDLILFSSRCFLGNIWYWLWYFDILSWSN